MGLSQISAKNITVEIESQLVLKEINLEIPAGECFVLVGPSGHGKTTLLKTLAGLINPQHGEVIIESIDWAKADVAEQDMLLAKIGMLFQKNALFDSLTCGENIAFPLRETTSLTELEIIDRVDYFLERVGIPHAKFLFPDEISGGMQKRLGIARALAREPEIIFYDDPTAGLDPITSRKIIELIIETKKKNNSTVVAVTNDMNRAYQMADRIGVLIENALIITGTKEQTLAHPDLRVQQFIHGRTDGPLMVLQ